MGLAAVAVIGTNNNPLYVRAFGHDITRFHFIVHTALDFVEEKVQRAAAPPPAPAAGGSSAAAAAKQDSYLGLLYPIEELRVYGYQSNTKVKLITVLDEEDVKDAEMKALFRRLHTLYVDTVSNPFHVADSELYDCASFDRQVERIVQAY